MEKDLIIEIEDRKYLLIKNYREGFNEEEFKSKYTSFFENYDFLVGDIAYSKLRLKGFSKKENKIYNKINDYKRIDKYIEENCAFDCRHFILEKMK